jgi:squalene-hopene/tetraprenyl-beta-curcumene cyclase
MAPANYQSRPEIKENVAALTAYLRQDQKTQLLHNRLFLLWASAKLRDLLPDEDKQSILQDLWSKQESDGGWTLQSLGPWKKRDAVTPPVGSNSYATALAAFASGQAGVKPSQANQARALAWLRTHQDAQSGNWTADSMNHKHSSFGPVPEKFMSDAATGYATAALLAAADQGTAATTKPRN